MSEAITPDLPISRRSLNFGPSSSQIKSILQQNEDVLKKINNNCKKLLQCISLLQNKYAKVAYKL